MAEQSGSDAEVKGMLGKVTGAIKDTADAVYNSPAVAKVREFSDSAGAAPLHAVGRAGLKDLQDVVLQAFPDSKQTRDEPGSIANPTSQLVTEQMTGNEVDPQKDTITAPSSDMDVKKSLYGNLPAQQTPKGNENQHEQGRGGR